MSEEEQAKPGFIGRILRGIGVTLSKTTMFVVERVAGILIVLAIIYGLPYYVLQNNPEIKGKIMDKLQNVDQFFSGSSSGGGGGTGGIDIQGLLSIFSSNKSPSKERVIERTIVQQKLDYIPSQLAPFVQALEQARASLEGTSEVERYKAMLTSERVGSNGEKAVPMLEKALLSPSKIIRKGAYDSLKLVGTPDAKKALTDYINRMRR